MTSCGLLPSGSADRGRGRPVSPAGPLHPGQDSRPASHGRSLASSGRIWKGTREARSEEGRRCLGDFSPGPMGLPSLPKPKEPALPVRVPRMHLSHLHSCEDGVHRPFNSADPLPARSDGCPYPAGVATLLGDDRRPRAAVLGLPPEASTESHSGRSPAHASREEAAVPHVNRKQGGGCF